MRRRALLSLCGVAVAGCVGDDTGVNSPTDADNPASATTNPSTTPATGTTSDDLPVSTIDQLPEKLDIGVPRGDTDCPAPEHVSRVVCSPETDPDSVPMAMTVDADSVTLESPQTLTFELENGTEGTFSTNPYDWTLWKRADEEWHRVAPELVQEPLLLMRPGRTVSWALALDHALPTPPEGEYYSWNGSGSVPAIGGGQYAFGLSGWFDTAEGTQNLLFAARFSIDAPATTLEPTDAVTEVQREGNVVTVRGEWEDGGEGETQTSRVTVSRDDSDVESRLLLPEVAARHRMLRNTLPYFEEGVREVRYLERNRYVPSMVGVPSRFAFEGAQFSKSSEESVTETESA